MIITEKLEKRFEPDQALFRSGLSRALCQSFSSYRFHGTRRTEWPWALSLIPQESKSRILDIGSDPLFSIPLVVLRPGMTVYVHQTHQNADDVTMSNKGMARNHRHFWHNHREQIRMVMGLPRHFEEVMRGGVFDVITCISVIEHVPREELMGDWLEPMFRLLAPGGKLIMTMDWSEGGDDEPGHVQNHDLSEWLRSLEKSGCKLHGIEDTPFLGNHLPSERKTFNTFGSLYSPLSVFGFIIEKGAR